MRGVNTFQRAKHRGHLLHSLGTRNEADPLDGKERAALPDLPKESGLKAATENLAEKRRSGIPYLEHLLSTGALHRPVTWKALQPKHL
jgi:hypothetical protein